MDVCLRFRDGAASPQAVNLGRAEPEFATLRIR